MASESQKHETNLIFKNIEIHKEGNRQNKMNAIKHKYWTILMGRLEKELENKFKGIILRLPRNREIVD